MRVLAIVMACLPAVGCSFTPRGAPIDPMPGSDACTTFSSQFDTCGMQPAADLTITGMQCWNTDTHELLDAACSGTPETLAHLVVVGATGELDVLLGKTITIAAGGRLRVVGSRPFGMLAFASITLDGELDAVNGGAGARAREACTTAAGGIGLDDDGGAPGGGGGAMRGNGGVGGTGDSNGGSTAGGMGGVGIALPLGPLGGCPGGDGGNGSASSAGAGGSGGGAIYLVSAATISVAGSINAGGGGGEGGIQDDGGGGGGGAGGMILLEAPDVTVTGVLAANGGAGGGGSTDSASGGRGGDALASDQPALGGPRGASAGTDGANGAAGATIDGPPRDGPPNDGAAGGGGGAVGYISIITPTVKGSGTFSPALTPFP